MVMKSKPQTMQMASDALSYSQLINFLSLLPSFLYKSLSSAPLGRAPLTASSLMLPNTHGILLNILKFLLWLSLSFSNVNKYKMSFWEKIWGMYQNVLCSFLQIVFSLYIKEDHQTSQAWRKSTLNIQWKEAEAEAPILWPPDAKNWLIWKDPEAGKDWRQEEKGMTEDEMVG